MREKKLFCAVVFTPWFIVLTLALVLAFTSCNENGSDDPLVGTWKQVNYVTQGSNARSEQILVLKANNHFTFENTLYMDDNSKHVSTVYEGTWSVNENLVTVRYERMVEAYHYDDTGTQYPFEQKFRYVINGNTMKVTWLYDSTEYTEEYTKQ